MILPEAAEYVMFVKYHLYCVLHRYCHEFACIGYNLLLFDCIDCGECNVKRRKLNIILYNVISNESKMDLSTRSHFI